MFVFSWNSSRKQVQAAQIAIMFSKILQVSGLFLNSNFHYIIKKRNKTLMLVPETQMIVFKSKLKLPK